MLAFTVALNSHKRRLKNFCLSSLFFMAWLALMALCLVIRAPAQPAALGQLRGGLSFAKDFQIAGGNLDFLWPLYDKGKILFFSQSSASYGKNSRQLTMGLGNRYFTERFMFGVNGFFAYDVKNSAAQFGAGLELWHDYWRLAANSYFGPKGWQLTSFSQDHSAFRQRSANGFDINLQAYLPVYPQIGVSGRYQRYYGAKVDLMADRRLRTEPQSLSFGLSYRPLPLFAFDLSYKRGSKLSAFSVSAKLAYQIGISLKDQLDSSKIDVLRRLGGARHDFVERNNNIILAYRPDVPVILRDITGAPGSEHFLVAKAALAGWQIKKWLNKANLSLSKECFSAADLAACKVLLPKESSDDLLWDDYDLTLILQRPGDSQDYSYHAHIMVKHKSRK